MEQGDGNLQEARLPVSPARNDGKKIADVTTVEDRIRESSPRIYNLIASHPPSAVPASAIISGRGPRTANSTAPSSASRSGIRPPAHSNEHRRAVGQGIARRTLCRIEGDTAFAISIYKSSSPGSWSLARGFHVHRISANRWEFMRTGKGWKIKRRHLRALDGSEPARDILRGTFA